MSEFGQDVKAKIAENAAKRAAASQPAPTPQESPIVTQTKEQLGVVSEPVVPKNEEQAVPATILPVTPTAADADPKDTTTKPETVAQTVEEVPQWDANLVDTPPAPSGQYDFKKLGSALSIEVQSEEDL